MVRFLSIARTFRSIYPPYLLIMVLFVQVVAFIINPVVYDTRELLIIACWIPLFTITGLLVKSGLFYRVCVVLFFVEGFINLCHLIILKCPVSASSLFILSNTNYSEAKEFLTFKFNLGYFLIIPFLILLFLALRNQSHISSISKPALIMIGILIIAFFGESIINRRFIRKAVPQTGKAIVSFIGENKSFKKLKTRIAFNLKANLSHTLKNQQVFVLIIGESCSRNHMSLYNYSRQTNPKLGKRKDIIIYDNVISPCSNTIGSIFMMLSEASLNNKISLDKAVNLIDVFHSLNFRTYWISNQSPIGIWDNAIFNLAQTCDITFFKNNFGSSSLESTYLSPYDENLIQPFDKVLNEINSSKFIVIHLMGSHSEYSKRYPRDFNQFDRYNNVKETLINEYDNSVLYNDFIVDSIFNILNHYSELNDTYICSAIYLSDHGENVYDELDKTGHDYSDIIPKANVEIPFIIWTSPLYQTTFPDKYKYMLSHKTYPFITDDLFHAVLDMNMIQSPHYLSERSVFSENINSNRRRILEDGRDYDTN